MMEARNAAALNEIRANIEKFGHHIYVVSHGAVPRFAYTIGLWPRIAAELIFAGASFYTFEEVKSIINGVAERLPAPADSSKFNCVIQNLGSFTLRKVSNSWSSELLLGAFDFYRTNSIPALQIVPDKEHWTVDVPNLSFAWNRNREPVWKWLREPWTYPIPSNAVAITNLDALRGHQVTEAARWEVDQWELFAGAGPDIPHKEIRAVPLGTLLAIDNTLDKVVALGIGEALWRNSGDIGWKNWQQA